MKKIILTISSLCMIYLLCLPVTAFAKTNAENATDAYNTFIGNHSLASAVIVDLDNNKIPELLCFDKDTWKSSVYSYSPSKNKMVRLCSIDSGKGYGSYYNVKKHHVALFSCTTGGSIYKVYKIKGTKAIKKATYTSTRKYPSFDYTYKKNKKKLSYAKWNKQVSSIAKKWKVFRGNF